MCPKPFEQSKILKGGVIQGNIQGITIGVAKRDTRLLGLRGSIAVRRGRSTGKGGLQPKQNPAQARVGHGRADVSTHTHTQTACSDLAGCQPARKQAPQQEAAVARGRGSLPMLLKADGTAHHQKK